MNNFYTLHHVAKFLDGRLKGAGIVSVLSRKKRLLEFNLTTNGTDCQLVFHATTSAALFLQDGQNDVRKNAASIFEDVWGGIIERVWIDDSDRIISIGLDGDCVIRLVMFGPGANAHLIEGDSLIDSFRNALPPESKLPYKPGDVHEVERASDIRSRILVRNPRFPRQLIDRVVKARQLDALPAAELCMMVDGLTDKMLDSPSFRMLSDRTISLLDLNDVPDDSAVDYPDVNSLVRACWVQREIRDKFTSRKYQVAADLESAARKYETIANSLSDDSKSIQRADHYETIGHILMAYSHLDPPASDKIKLEDVFNPGTKIEIKVKPGSSFSENAQLYYQKAKNTRKTMEANAQRLLDAESKLAQVKALQTSYQDVDGPRTLERWIKQHEVSLNSVLPSRKNVDGTSKPWRELNIGKFEVWIGKSASGNDELLQASHKEDIWLHARHVSGSHVVIRMARGTDFPPIETIETAASWAAWYSKAKSAGMVPVVYTKRKFVRKPKGSAPGMALVDKEQVCLVEPSKPPNSTAE